VELVTGQSTSCLLFREGAGFEFSDAMKRTPSFLTRKGLGSELWSDWIPFVATSVATPDAGAAYTRVSIVDACPDP
jgi:hypothetical protein